MKAVQLTNGRTHWVYDDHTTLCGRPLISLPVAREIDVNDLTGDVCRMCDDAAVQGGLLPAARITLRPSRGRYRKAGPISHGPHSKGVWHDIWGGDE